MAADSYEKLRPAPDPLSAAYWKAATEKRLLIQRCTGCGRFQFYPRRHCIHCGQLGPEWFEACGRGKVHTFTVIHRNGSPGFADELPYVFAIVELEEGVRMSANIINTPPDDVVVDMAVHAVFIDITDEIAIPQFERAV